MRRRRSRTAARAGLAGVGLLLVTGLLPAVATAAPGPAPASSPALAAAPESELQRAPRRPDLVVTTLRAPDTVRVGERLRTTIAVANRGRSRAAGSMTTVALSTDATAGGDRRLKPVWRTPSLRPKASARTTLQVSVPGDLAPGSYHLVACADSSRAVRESDERRNCRVRTSPVRVDGPPSSHDLIEEAVARGELTEEQGLVYEVFADYLDPRLPERFVGVPDGLEHGAAAEAVEQWESLSPATQETLQPFLMPPMYAGSHWSPWPDGEPPAAAGPSPASRGAAGVPWCGWAGQTFPLVAAWDHIDSQSGAVRVWWLRKNPGDAATAAHVAALVGDRILPALTALMGRGPLSDEGVVCDGGDAALDIALVDASTATTQAHTLSCGATGSSVHMVLPRTASMAGWRGLDPYIAHEVMHAIQYGMPVNGTCREYYTLREMTAEWVQDFVTDPLYGVNLGPDDTEFQAAESYLLAPGISLETRNYAAYLLPFWAARRSGPEIVREMWEQAATRKPMAAVDAALPGGFEDTWADFALANWNKGPITDYRDWDDLPLGAQLAGGVPVPVERDHAFSVNVDHLAAKYLTLNPEPGVKQIEVTHDLHADPDADLRALVRYDDGSHQVIDLAGREKTLLCLDDGSRKAIEVVLVYSDSSLERDLSFRTSVRGLKGCACDSGSPDPGDAPVCVADANLTWSWSDTWEQEGVEKTVKGVTEGQGSARVELVESRSRPGEYESAAGSTYAVHEKTHVERTNPNQCDTTTDITVQGDGRFPQGTVVALHQPGLDQLWLSHLSVLMEVTQRNVVDDSCFGLSTDTFETVMTAVECEPDPQGTDTFWEFEAARPGAKEFSFSCSGQMRYEDGTGRHVVTATASGTLSIARRG